ncbi:MAG TPA: NADH-quinone oxidoreductase subunit H [Candidatus Andersenbacteria bacterium]|nr:NADH-quinone oxidoreductase subunit H [Candidatus Andersenbacteria bacterium]
MGNLVLVSSLVQAALLPALAPLVVGGIKLLKARLQNRRGAPLWQPYRNLWKLWHKDEVISTDASWIFTWAPYVMFGSTLVVAALIPVITLSVALPEASDVLVIVYAVALGIFFMALAGLDVGSAFGGLGASREMTLSALNEGGLLFAILPAAIATGTTHLPTIMGSQLELTSWHVAPWLLAGSAFFIALLAENARYPFDNPATHLELTMVHEAMILEYSGKRLALLEWTAATKLLLFTVLGVNIFWPGSIANLTAPLALLSSFLVLLVKVAVVAAAIAAVESSMPKLRYFRLPDLLFTSFLLGAIAIIMVAL